MDSLILAALLIVAAPSDACTERLERAIRALEPLGPSARVCPVLEMIAEECEVLPAALRSAAREAARVEDGKRRAQVLARGVPEQTSCRAGAEVAAAVTVELQRACLRPGFRMTESLREALDRGTFTFAVATYDALRSAGAGEDVARRVIENLLLAAAKSSGGHRR